MISSIIRKFNSVLSCTLLMFLMLFSSCKKFVDIPPPTFAIAENGVFTNDNAAIAVLNGIYTNISSSGTFSGARSISLLSGLSADEFILYSGGANTLFDAYYRNTLSPVNTPIAGIDHWKPLYNYVFRCNAAIEGLESSKAEALTSTVRQQLMGEAKFLRGFFYFYLVNLFGDVPLPLTTDYQINSFLSRSPKADVYKQIIQDIRDAEQLLSSNYLNETLLTSSAERIRPSKWAASALLARVYLYIGDWANAESKASTVINNTSLFDTASLNKVFLKASLGNKEAIWQIQPTVTSSNTQESLTFVITSSGPNGTRPVYLSNLLLNSFEQGDMRGKPKNWIDTITVLGTYYRFPYKYKIIASNPNINASNGSAFMTEFLMMLRLGEQYLIRAEARAQSGNIAGAQSDLNVIRTRAGLPNTTAGDQSSLIAAILHERQIELFSEFGNRWLDLKRTGNVDAVMNVITPLKVSGVAWQSYQQLYPLPLETIQNAPNVVQNLGY